MKLDVVAPALAALLAGCGGPPAIEAADRAALGTAVAQAKGKVAKLLAERREGLRAASAQPPATAGACPVTLPPADALVQKPDGPPPTGDGAHSAAVHFTLLPRWALDGAAPPPTRSAQEDSWARRGFSGVPHGQYELSLKFIEETLARGTLDRSDTLDALRARIAHLASDEAWDWELVVVTDKFTSAAEVGEGRFSPGEITGRAFVWSFREHAVLCAGTVAAHNQDEVKSIKVSAHLRTGQNGFLDHDLEAQAFAAAVTGLQKITK